MELGVADALAEIRAKEAERATYPPILESMREETDPERLAYRNECGQRWVQLRDEIVLLSVPVLQDLGMTTAAEWLETAAVDQGIATWDDFAEPTG